MVGHLPWLACLLTVTAGASRLTAADDEQRSVAHLDVTTDYHSADISWRLGGSGRLFGFNVGYCEMQAWGANRCKSKIALWRPGQNSSVPYQVTIGGLRMDTEYEFTVTPLDRRMKKERALSQSQQARTKAFSASTRCLGGASEVTVHTGPHFGGRLSVEDDPSEACRLQGDPASDRQVYVLTIDHAACRTQRSEAEVRTFVMVQEQDTIQTHSTRRFLVICNYQSESFTVSAGVNLPRTQEHVAVGSRVQEVSLEELETPQGSRDPPRLVELTSREGRQLILSADRPASAASRVAPVTPSTAAGAGGWAQLVLMLVVIAAAVFGVAIGAIFSRRATLRRRQRTAPASSGPGSSSGSGSGSGSGSDVSSDSSGGGGAAGLPMELRRDAAHLTADRLAMVGGDYPSVTC